MAFAVSGTVNSSSTAGLSKIQVKSSEVSTLFRTNSKASRRPNAFRALDDAIPDLYNTVAYCNSFSLASFKILAALFTCF